MSGLNAGSACPERVDTLRWTSCRLLLVRNVSMGDDSHRGTTYLLTRSIYSRDLSTHAIYLLTRPIYSRDLSSHTIYLLTRSIYSRDLSTHAIYLLTRSIYSRDLSTHATYLLTRPIYSTVGGTLYYTGAILYYTHPLLTGIQGTSVALARSVSVGASSYPLKMSVGCRRPQEPARRNL